jgi:hypothetical protein
MEDQLFMTGTVRKSSPLMLAAFLALAGAVVASARPASTSDSNVTRAQLGLLDRFLDTHPGIAQQLMSNPSLIDNRSYVNSEPALQAFLQDHPDIRQDWQANPQLVMKEAEGIQAPQPTPAPAPVKVSNTLTIDQVATLQDFLNAHPAIAKQLEANPSLIDNKDYMASNPALDEFLQAHPELAEAWKASPSITMTEVSRLAASEAKFTSGQITTLDDFLNSHPAIAQKLEADPSLIDDANFLRDNPDLASFLQNHPDLAQDWRNNPQAAVVDVIASKVTTGTSGSITEAEVKTFNAFLEDHPEIDAELIAHPAEIENAAYVDDHPELQSFLRDHPEVATGLRDNPQLFMSYVEKLDGSTTTTAAARPTPPVRTPATLRK